jgi:predicted anti-sigma-YlaC factor YlaD
MNCRHFVPDVIDQARGVVLEPSRQRAVTSHLRSCASCAALAERHSAMSLALRRVASAIPEQPPDDLELQRMLASFDRRRVRPRRIGVGVGLSLAASVLIVAGLSIGWKQDVPRGGAPAVAATPLASATDAPSVFVALPGASALPHFERGEVIRVEVPSAAGAIQVDVLIGQDGLARAARLVQ